MAYKTGLGNFDEIATYANSTYALAEADVQGSAFLEAAGDLLGILALFTDCLNVNQTAKGDQ